MRAQSGAAAALAVGLCTLASLAHAAPPRHSAQAPAYSVVERIPAADGGWDFAYVDAPNGMLYVARSNGVTQIDLASRKPTQFHVEAHRAHQVLTLDSGRELFETDGETGLGRFISVADGKVLAEVATGKKADAAFIDPASGKIAVMNAGDGTVALLDPATRTLVSKIDVGGALEVGVADGRGGAFINIEDAGVIARVDLVHARKTGMIALPGCEGPTGLALVAHGTRLITSCANGVALVLDAASGRVLSRLAIGRDPDGVLVDETRGLAFIPCGGSGTLIQIAIRDAGHIRVVAAIPTQIGAKTGAIDPRDGRIYLPTATLAAPEPGAKRGKPVPGSFTILVVGTAG